MTASRGRGVGRGSLSSAQRLCHQETKAGPGALGPQIGPQGKAGISFPEISHAGQGHTSKEALGDQSLPFIT